MKKFLKRRVASILSWQVRRLRHSHPLKVIAVAGSIGKTSSKLAIASVLSKSFMVRYQTGNYNDIVTVPLVFFGDRTPNIFNPLAWLWIFAKNELKIRKAYPYQVVVIELGTDGPGQINEFKKYTRADIGVLTAITPEHMEYFANMDAVAEEELGITQIASKTYANKDLIDPKYLKGYQLVTYSTTQSADISLSSVKFSGDEASFEINKNGKLLLKSGHQKITEPQLYSIAAAAAIAAELGMKPNDIDEGIRNIPAVSGRMQHLEGLNGSTIIDDTYNSSPQAVKAALDTLYRLPAKHKIAVLGNMNELGHHSQTEHQLIGQYCDPKQLSLVMTIGPDANKYLAKAAEKQGCKVKTFEDPYAAGNFLKTLLREGTLVLVKGSQNKVYAEETVKLVLANADDSAKLVRQSQQWLKVKQRNFK